MKQRRPGSGRRTADTYTARVDPFADRPSRIAVAKRIIAGVIDLHRRRWRHRGTGDSATAAQNC